MTSDRKQGAAGDSHQHEGKNIARTLKGGYSEQRKTSQGYMRMTNNMAQLLKSGIATKALNLMT